MELTLAVQVVFLGVGVEGWLLGGIGHSAFPFVFRVRLGFLERLGLVCVFVLLVLLLLLGVGFGVSLGHLVFVHS